MKRALSVFMAVVMTLAMFSVPVVAEEADAAAVAPAVILETDVKTAKPGDIVTVSAFLSSNSKLAALTYEVYYDLAYFQYVDDSYAAGSGVFTLQEVKDSSPGTIRYTGVSAMNASDVGGKLFSFKVKVVKVDGVLTTAIKEGFVANGIEAVDVRNDMNKLSTKSLTVACAHGNTTEIVLSESSCSVNGEKAIDCLDCKKRVKTEQLPLGDHIEGDWEVETPSTCLAEGTQVKKCTVCSTVLQTETLPVSECVGDGNWITSKEPTCSEEGSEYQVCSVCGKFAEERAIPALPHTPEGDWVKVSDVSCDTDGKEIRVCSVCAGSAG